MYSKINMAIYPHKWFVRSKQPLVRLRIQPRDLEILADIAEYRFLDFQQILALHPASLRNTQHRLTWLWNSHFVDRPEAQTLLTRKNSPIIYSLGKKGAEVLLRPDLAGKRKTAAGVRYLAHAMMISQFHCVLALALQKHQTEFRLGRWLQGQELKNKLSGQRGNAGLYPDAFFSIEQGGRQLNFFLEADRGKEQLDIFLDKLKTYWNWRHDQRLLSALKISKYFRVLTITDTKGRLGSLRLLGKQAERSTEGGSRFLFACEQSYSLEKPQDILSPVWLSPKDEILHRLLD